MLVTCHVCDELYACVLLKLSYHTDVVVQVQRILSGRSTNTGSMIGRQGGPLPPPPPPGGNCSLVICFLVRWPFVRVWVLLLLGFWLLPSSFLHGIPHVSCTIFLHHAGIPPAPPSLSGSSVAVASASASTFER